MTFFSTCSFHSLYTSLYVGTSQGLGVVPIVDQYVTDLAVVALYDILLDVFVP